jgi:hypothetical protein
MSFPNSWASLKDSLSFDDISGHHDTNYKCEYKECRIAGNQTGIIFAI